MKKKEYILQEKDTNFFGTSWFDKYYSDDLEFLKKIKKIYEEKYSCIYRIIEVI